MKEQEVKETGLNPVEFGLTEEKTTTIVQAFAPKIAEREALRLVYESLLTQELTKETCKQAREARLKLVKIRTGIAEVHKTEKAFYLSAGKFIDAWKNKETLPVMQMEEKLEEIETFFERQEAARKEAIVQDRIIKVSKFAPEMPRVEFDNMGDETFNMFLDGLEKKHNEKIEAERKAKEEEERLIAVNKLHESRKDSILHLWNYASDFEKSLNFGEQSQSDFDSFVERLTNSKKEEDDRLEKLRLEKEKLEKEAAEKEAAIKAAEEKARKEREKAKAEADKLAKENEAKLEAERAEKKRLESELEAKKQAEAKAEAERKAAEEAAIKAAEEAKKAPIKEQMNKWVDSFQLPELSVNNDKKTDIVAKFEAFKKWAKTEVTKL